MGELGGGRKTWNGLGGGGGHEGGGEEKCEEGEKENKWTYFKWEIKCFSRFYMGFGKVAEGGRKDGG